MASTQRCSTLNGKRLFLFLRKINSNQGTKMVSRDATERGLLEQNPRIQNEQSFGKRLLKTRSVREGCGGCSGTG